MNQKQWDAEWMRQYNKYWQDPRTRSKAKAYADEYMARSSPRPDGPPTAMGLAWRIFWLVKVKGMDWQKMLVGAAVAFVTGALAALATVTEGGITGQEWGIIVGAGTAALALYLKDPNKHKGQDPRQKPGVKNILKK